MCIVQNVKILSFPGIVVYRIFVILVVYGRYSFSVVGAFVHVQTPLGFASPRCAGGEGDIYSIFVQDVRHDVCGKIVPRISFV